MRQGKRLLSLLIVLTMIFSSSISVFAVSTDIDKHWAKEEINYMKEKGILAGYPDGTFRPDNRMTKAEFYKVINELIGYSEMGEVNFDDVNQADWFYSDVAKGVKAGYIVEQNMLMPNAEITREEVARIIGITFGLEEDPKGADVFLDSSSISPAAKGFVGALRQKDFIKGYPDGRFLSKGSITRAEVVTMLYNITGEIVNVAGTVSKDVKTNLVVNTTDVVLKNMTIEGDVYLAEGIGEGDVTLDNVVVEGEVYVKGGGSNSIHIRNSKLNSIVINKVASLVRVVLEGTQVENVKISNETKLELGEGTDIKQVVAEAAANIVVEKGATIDALDVDSKEVEIESEGTIESIIAHTEAKINGKTVKEGTEYKIEEGKSTEIKKDSKQETGSTGGSGGGGITPPKVRVSAISVDKETMLMEVGTTGKITATISPSNATNKKINWASSDDTVATVDANGNVTAVASGEAIITAISSENANIKAECKVTVANDWSELADVAWYGDESEGTYIIETAEQLAGLAMLVNRDQNPVNFEGKTIKLGSDIDLHGLEWVPIGFINETTELTAGEYDYNNAFRGSFDGQNHTISNLKIDKGDYKAVGLFGVISMATENIEIKNVKLVNSIVNGYTGVGVLAGMARAGTKWVSGVGHAAQISGIEVSTATVTGLKYVGGIIGYSTASIQGSLASNVEITANYKTGMAGKSGEAAGGIVGNLYDLYSITNCIVTDSTIVSQTRAGGIAGSSRYARDISDCKVSDVTIELIESDDGDAENEGYAGYISGRAEADVINLSSNNEVENSIAVIYGVEKEISNFCTPIGSISVEPQTMTLVVGDTSSITVTVTPENVSNNKVIWSSNNPNIVTVTEDGVVTAVAAGEATITATSAANSSKKSMCKVIVCDAGTIKKTAFWGTPDNVLYYFDFELGNELKIGDLTSLVAKAYAGDTLLSIISLKEETLEEYADKTSLGGSFRSNPEASPSSFWNLEAFDGTMPTEIVVEFTTEDGKTYIFGTKDIEWIDEGYKANVTAGDFSVMTLSDVMGYNVGLILSDATVSDVEEVVVKLYKDGQLLAINTATGLMEQYPDNTSLSAPFDVFGSFDYEKDGCWEYSGWLGDNADIPNKAEIKVTFKNGVIRETINEDLTGDTSIFTRGDFSKNTVTTKAHNTVDGYIVDIRLTDGATFEKAAVTVSLYDDAGNLMQSNTLPENHGWTLTSLTVPFDVRGSYDYENPAWSDGIKWIVKESVKGVHTTPAKVVIEVTLVNGKLIIDTLTDIKPMEWPGE